MSIEQLFAREDYIVRETYIFRGLRMTRQTPLKVNVRVYRLVDGAKVQDHIIDYHASRKRRWLQKLCVWAWFNQHSVVMDNTLDEQLVKALDNDDA